MGQDHVDVGAEAAAVRAHAAVRTARGEVIVAAGVIDEAALPLRHSRKQVTGGISRRGSSGQHVCRHHAVRHVGENRRQARRVTRSVDAVGIVARHVVDITRIRDRCRRSRGAAVEIQDGGVAGHDRVVVDRHRVGAVAELKRARSAPIRLLRQIVKQVVLDREMVGLLAGGEVVVSEHVDAAGAVAYQVAAHRHPFHGRPRRVAVLIPRRELEGVAGLIGDPQVLDDIAFDATSRAFFNSNRFLTAHFVAFPGVPAVPAAPESVNAGAVVIQ